MRFGRLILALFFRRFLFFFYFTRGLLRGLVYFILFFSFSFSFRLFSFFPLSFFLLHYTRA